MTPYRELAVDPALRRWVECAWRIESSEPISSYAVRPDGCLDILYSREEGLRVVGAMTAEMRVDFPAGVSGVGVRFHPGMAGAFLRTAPGELTDRILAAEALWGRRARDLASRLDDGHSSAQWIAILLGTLRPPAHPSPVQRAIEALTASHGAADLEWLARQAHLGPRQFRRRCLEEAGLAPKHLSRVLRFRRACQLASAAARPEWAGIAADAGYFDQAHLIRDFREFAGATPMAVFSNPRPARFLTIAS
ncbi:MAG TPA: helix-turn-helix domain-containing protein [Candidatus Sulfopaludibacter sp.]|nr:helix-turn-helix domain-containing protein [Candidatus Sulfopaludibacter sp.]